MKLLVALLGTLSIAVAIVAGSDEPVFVRWLDPSLPLDATIQNYWQRAQADELSPVEWVDLGTMLFKRGFANDAIDAFRAAVKRDQTLAEGWFKMGLVYQKKGKLSDAERAYSKCLDIRPGHGWANFYLGLLEERAGHAKAAIAHYQTAFRHAPELADPEQNSELPYSELALAARIDAYRADRFELHAPMAYLEPARVKSVGDRLVPPPPPVPTPLEMVAEEPAAVATPSPVVPSTTIPNRTDVRPTSTAEDTTTASPKGTPWGVRGRATGRAARPAAPRPTPTGSSGNGTKNGAAGGGTMPHLRDVSPEARLRELIPGLHAWLLDLDLRPA